MTTDRPTLGTTTAELRASLAYAEPTPAPDVDVIVARGRRLRTGRAVSAGVAVAAVTATAVAAGAVLTVPATAPTTTIPSRLVVASAVLSTAAPTDGEAPDRFDPLEKTLRVDWRPDGLTGESIEVTPFSQSYASRDAAWVEGGPDLALSVQVLAKGQDPQAFLSSAGVPIDAMSSPAEPVNGGRAECLTERTTPDQPTCATLRWEYAPGAWAQASYAGSAATTPGDTAAVVRRVAESVSLTDPEPIRLPFRLGDRFDGLGAIRTNVSVPADAGSEEFGATIAMTEDPSSLTLDDVQPGGDPWGTQPSFGVDVSRTEGDPLGTLERDEPPNTTVDGHPATEYTSPRSRALAVYGVSGTRVSVGYANMPGDPREAYDGVTLVADPGDVTSWVAPR